jgi:hypothetical protein
VSETVEFGGWPRPPRWVWVVAGVAAVAVLAGVVVARRGPHHAASPPPATAPVRGPGTPAAGSAARWPSVEGACRLPVYLPRIHLARHHAPVHVAALAGGTALRQVTPGGTLSRPLPGLPGPGRVVTKLVSGPGADYAFVDPQCSDYLWVYRIVAGAAHRLDTAAFDLLGGPHHAWAVTYPRHTLLTPLNGGRTVTLKAGADPVADTAAGLVVAYHPRAGRPGTLELVDPKTGASAPPRQGLPAGRRRRRRPGKPARLWRAAGQPRVHPGKHRLDDREASSHVRVAGRSRPGLRCRVQPRRHGSRVPARAGRTGSPLPGRAPTGRRGRPSPAYRPP